jgi:hypothetical protein
VVHPERAPDPEDDAGEEIDVGEALREAFDPEKGELPPLFFETVLLAEGIEEKISRHERKAFEERVLRRFFASIGKDYDAWRRERWRRWSAALILVSLFALLLGAGAAVSLLPDLGRLAGPATPATEQHVAHYGTVAEIQSYFPVHLPEEPPEGYEMADVVLEARHPAGPRAAISYRQGGTGLAGDRVDLFVRLAADEAFTFPLSVSAEPIDLAGVPGYWVEGPAGGNDGDGASEVGRILWEQGGGRFALASTALPEDEITDLAKELSSQVVTEGAPR